MHLKSITLKGFKSFPDRTNLEFGPGVSVIVGPNGSGKSNITDAVLWALGEQSPLAVRGQTMQDVIFAGGHGVKGRNACEVEVVIDNSDHVLHSEFSEVSVSRKIDRSGEGVYMLNGARCRLVDVIEVLSDSGLGKEMHSVISQGRVEAIIHSKPLDRTALIEEAAGLSKHRKRRRRAELKLGRTQDNLSRALDVEREARSHLRPLKRQAEAAELHARLERQGLELRGRMTRDDLRQAREELSAAERSATDARRNRDGIDAERSDVARQREQVERHLAEHGSRRELHSSRLLALGTAAERISLRLESVRTLSRALEGRLARGRQALSSESGEVSAESGRLGELEQELAALERERDARLAQELEGLERERSEADARASELAGALDAKRGELEDAERAAAAARERRRAGAEQMQDFERRRAALEHELSAIAERRRLVGDGERAALATSLAVDGGFEAALAGALGGRLAAAVVGDLREGARVVERAAEEGGRALVRGAATGSPRQAPVAGAERLLDHVRPEPDVRGLVEALLADAWVVERLDDVPPGFEGIAVTRAGTAYHGALREVRRLPAGGAERTLAEGGRRREIEQELGRLTADADEARIAAGVDAQAERDAENRLDAAEVELRELRRQGEQERERAERAGWLVERRRESGSGPDDMRRSELVAEIAAERLLAQRLTRERAEQEARRRRLEATVEQDAALVPVAERLASVLEGALNAAAGRRAALEQELEQDHEVGERAAAELRRLAQAEYEFQGRLREASELLTQEEVRVAHVREREQAVAGELAEIVRRLGTQPDQEPPLQQEERMDVEARLERLERRRERLGPVNPLAEDEYRDALEHVEELERQRTDLEQALAELEGLIRETDRRIRESFDETFAAAARNFEEVIEHLFPGGRGKLRLVKPQGPRAVLGGVDEQPADAEDAADGEQPGAEHALLADAEQPPPDAAGVEIEVTPAGKATKRLSLLSGGEKSLVALSFLFAVFLARPCPFYILDEVEAALDDLNIDRFLSLVRRYADHSQFIVITHQRRTMEAADVLYGVSMGTDGISKVVSRRLEREQEPDAERLTAVA